MSFKKTNIIKLIIIIGLFSFITAFMSCGFSDSSLFFNYGYNIRNGKVFYKQSFPDPVSNMDYADASTFKVISRVEDSGYADNGYFGTDKISVFYKGYKIAGSDGPSFQLLDVNYSKDKNQCYYRGSLIPEADPATFSIKDEDFSADKGHIFRRGIFIDHDTSIFQTFGDSSHVVRTANVVCIYETTVPIPFGATFKHLGYNYFALNNQVYLWDKPMPDVDIKSFTVTEDDFFSKTNKHVYYKSSIINGADAATYHLITSPYGKDDQHIFFFDKIIDGADVKTFEILNLNFQCARDKNAVYHEGAKISKFTQADLVNKNHCNNCNDTAIYFADSIR